MGTLNKDIRVFSGSTELVLVAPQGLAEDDENTDCVTQQMAEHPACAAIINTGLPRHKLDLNHISEAECHPAFIQMLRQIIHAK